MSNKARSEQLRRSQHHLENINAINAWRQEAVKHAINKGQVAAIDARVFELREAAAKGVAL